MIYRYCLVRHLLSIPGLCGLEHGAPLSVCSFQYHIIMFVTYATCKCSCMCVSCEECASGLHNQQALLKQTNKRADYVYSIVMIMRTMYAMLLVYCNTTYMRSAYERFGRRPNTQQRAHRLEAVVVFKSPNERVRTRACDQRNSFWR